LFDCILAHRAPSYSHAPIGGLGPDLRSRDLLKYRAGLGVGFVLPERREKMTPKRGRESVRYSSKPELQPRWRKFCLPQLRYAGDRYRVEFRVIISSTIGACILHIQVADQYRVITR
jgi:hypothetical protein